jgi:hypothetical protein
MSKQPADRECDERHLAILARRERGVPSAEIATRYGYRDGDTVRAIATKILRAWRKSEAAE